jgi:hypothetical protein
MNLPSQRGPVRTSQMQPTMLYQSRQVVNSNFRRFVARYLVKLNRSVAYLESFCQNSARRFLRSRKPSFANTQTASDGERGAEACRRNYLLDLDGGGLLRHAVYVGLREDKPAEDVRWEAARVR